MKSFIKTIMNYAYKKRDFSEACGEIHTLVNERAAEGLSSAFNVPVISDFVKDGDRILPALIFGSETPYATILYLMHYYPYRIGLAWANDLEGQPYFKLLSMHKDADEAFIQMNTTSFKVHIFDESGEDGGFIEFPRAYCLFAPEESEKKDGEE